MVSFRFNEHGVARFHTDNEIRVMVDEAVDANNACPLVVARKVFALLAYQLAKPSAYVRVVHVVVIHPSLIPHVVRRVDVYATYPSLVFGQQCLQSLKVVAVDDLVAAAGRRRVSWIVGAEAIAAFQRAERHVVMTVYDPVFPYPVECGHLGLQF